MQVCFLGLQAFSTLCQSVDFVNILTGTPIIRASLFCLQGKLAALRAAEARASLLPLLHFAKARRPSAVSGVQKRARRGILFASTGLEGYQ